MKAKLNCRKCGYSYVWTESDYDREGWKCKKCGNFNDKKSFATYKAKHYKSYEFCKKCNKLVKGYVIKSSTGYTEYGFKCECGNIWTVNWTTYF